MNQDQVLSLIRTVLKVAGTLLVAVGVKMDPTAWGTFTTALTDLIGALFVIGPTIWDFFTHSTAGKINALAASPAVQANPTAATAVATLQQTVAK